MPIKRIPHLYGEITDIEHEPGEILVSISGIYWIALPPSAEDSLKNVLKGDTLFIDLEQWAGLDIATVVIFRRDPKAHILRQVTMFHMGKGGCGMSGTLQNIALNLI